MFSPEDRLILDGRLYNLWEDLVDTGKQFPPIEGLRDTHTFISFRQFATFLSTFLDSVTEQEEGHGR